MKTLKILNLGAGVQSTTVYLMSCRGDEPEHVPAFDYAIFADTQEEPRAVYAHLEWLKGLGGPPILIDTAGKLGDRLTHQLAEEEYQRVLTALRFNRTLSRLKREHDARPLFSDPPDPLGFPDGPEREAVVAFLANPIGARKRPLGTDYASIPAYTSGIDGRREGAMRRQCTRDFKTNVVEEVIRRRILGIPFRSEFPADVRIHQYMGLSYDEPRRVAKVTARFESIAWAEPRFPLFAMEMTRGDCQAYLRDKVPHEVPRSACTFCPYHTNAEWRRLRNECREDWERACAVDEALRAPRALCNIGLDATLHLHRSCVPLRAADIDRDEPPMEQYLNGFDAECEGMCGV